MTTPHVIEMRLALEPITPDPFISHLGETVRRDGEARLRPADPTGKALRPED
jgi:hypothetical protein